MQDPPPQRLPGFDGLRALAISLVLWMHLEMNSWVHAGLPLAWGRQGVCLFFVLSGYLITRKLLEHSSLRRFYWRRAWRIFPPFYVYLAAVACLWLAGTYALSPLPFLAAATYWSNLYHRARGFPLEHTWSLAVEEQYYLAWPILLRLLGSARATYLLPCVFLLWPLQRGLRTGSFGHPSAEEAFFSATYDLLLWGSLGALLHQHRKVRGWLPPLVSGLLLVLLALATDKFWSALIPPLRGLSWMVFILWLVDHPKSNAVRWLEHPLLRWLGSRSYSIYLWHLIFCDPRLQQYFSWPTALVLALLSGEIAYRWIERPVLSYRDR